MPVEARFPDGAARPIAPYSPVIVSDGLVAISGQVPFAPDGTLVSDDFAEQAHQVFQNLSACLEAAGCGFEDVIKINAYISDFADFPTFNSVYETYFSAPFPARTTIQAGLFGFRIEVDAWARQHVHDTATVDHA
jgi:2-iminobutanoate/2-iminopropanoate deaminase